MNMPAKQCDECRIYDRILYRCKYNDKGWVMLCQQCLLNQRSKHADTFEFDETWKTF